MVPHPLAEVALEPERKDFVVQNVKRIGINIIRVQRPVWNCEQLSPDHGAVRLRIDNNANVFRGGCSGDQIIFPDDWFFVCHQILKSLCLAQFGNPGFAVFIFFKSVFFKPLCDKFRPFVAYGRFYFQVYVEKFFDPGKIIKGILGQIGVV